MTTKTINTWQGVAALVGITLGSIPLVQVLLTDAVGSVWALLLDEAGQTAAWPGPLVVVVVAIAVIALLERGKRSFG